MFENIRNLIKANLDIDWNIVKPFPLRNCIYNKIIKAGYIHKDFKNIQYNDLIKIKGIGKVKAKEFLLEKNNYIIKL
jgi:hypothetical protein